MLFTTLIILTLGASFAHTEPAAVDIGAEKHLFLDGFLIESCTSVQRVTQQAVKHTANPVLKADQPWEGGRAMLYGSVIRDRDIYRMWYMTPDGIACAESRDGIRWLKPALSVVRDSGRKTNLIFRTGAAGCELPHYLEFFGVTRDDSEKDPSRRYKMGYLSLQRGYSGPFADPFHSTQRRGLGVAVSPDGIHWESAGPWATHATVDGQTTWMHDTRNGRFVLYGRTKHTDPAVQAAWSKNGWYAKWHWGRSVARDESPDFLRWTDPGPGKAPLVLTADTEDEPGTEIYSMTVFPYGAAYIGLVQTYTARPDASWVELQLAVSHDSVHFTRVSDRKPFIGLGGVGEWDRFIITSANNPPIQVGEELRFYYGGRSARHSPYDGPDAGVDRGAIGVATVRLDRFAALQASYGGGTILTKPVRLTGDRLHLNAKADAGEIRIRALTLDGSTVAECEPVRTDSLDHSIVWKDGKKPGREERIRLEIGITNARLFAIWSK